MKHKIEVQNLYRGLGTQRRLTWQPCLDSGKILCERPKRKRAQCKLYRRPDTHTCYLLTIAHNKDQSALTYRRLIVSRARNYLDWNNTSAD